MARARSCCVISPSKPRRVPSTRRRYRSFSPSFIMPQEPITICNYRIAICNLSRTGFGLGSMACGRRLNQLSDDALQISRLGDVEQDGMVESCTALFQHTHAAAGVGCGRAEHLEELGFAHVKRA